MQKRRLPRAWIYMKRRRTKDYIRVAKVSEQIMVDFEIAAKRAFEKTFLRCTIKGCAFHFGQSLFKKCCATGLKQAYLSLPEPPLTSQTTSVQQWLSEEITTSLASSNAASSTSLASTGSADICFMCNKPFQKSGLKRHQFYCKKTYNEDNN